MADKKEPKKPDYDRPNIVIRAIRAVGNKLFGRFLPRC